MHISILAHCSPPCKGGEIEEDACMHPMRVSPDTVCFLNASVYECMCVCPASVCVCGCRCCYRECIDVYAVYLNHYYVLFHLVQAGEEVVVVILR